MKILNAFQWSLLLEKEALIITLLWRLLNSSTPAFTTLAADFHSHRAELTCSHKTNTVHYLTSWFVGQHWKQVTFIFVPQHTSCCFSVLLHSGETHLCGCSMTKDFLHPLSFKFCLQSPAFHAARLICFSHDSYLSAQSSPGNKLKRGPTVYSVMLRPFQKHRFSPASSSSFWNSQGGKKNPATTSNL